MLPLTASAQCRKGPTNPHDNLSMEGIEALRAKGPSPDESLAPALKVPEDALTSEVLHGVPIGKNRFVAAWSYCQERRCRAYVGVLRRSAKGVRIVRKKPLKTDLKPFPPVDGLSVVQGAVADLDADGRPEYVVYYGATSEPEAAVGSRSAAHVTIFKLPTLEVSWSAEVARGGQASVHEGCDYELRRIDVDCDKHPDLVFTQTCQEQYCQEEHDEVPDECKEGPEVDKIIDRYDPAKDEYVSVYGHTSPSPIKDDKPYLVIAGSFPVERFRADVKAGTLLGRLVSKGITDASLVDSRAFPKLKCCFHTVLGGRFATAKEALQRVKALKPLKIKAYVRKGF